MRPVGYGCYKNRRWRLKTRIHRWWWRSASCEVISLLPETLYICIRDYARLELSMLIVKLLAKSSTALSNVRLRHIHEGFVNRLLDILEKFFDVSISCKLVASRAAAACCHSTGPSCPIPITLSPVHYKCGEKSVTLIRNDELSPRVAHSAYIARLRL